MCTSRACSTCFLLLPVQKASLYFFQLVWLLHTQLQNLFLTSLGASDSPSLTFNLLVTYGSKLPFPLSFHRKQLLHRVTLTAAVTKGGRTLPMPKEAAEAACCIRNSVCLDTSWRSGILNLGEGTQLPRNSLPRSRPEQAPEREGLGVDSKFVKILIGLQWKHLLLRAQD